MNYYGHGGIASLSPYASGGYIEPYGLGGWLKGIGGLLAGVAGMGIAGPLGAAVASGLFSGIADKSVKSGLLSGLTAYLGSSALQHAGKGLDAASKAAIPESAIKLGADKVATSVPEIALTEAARLPTKELADVGFREGIRSLGSGAGRRAALDYLADAKKAAFLYPLMGNLAYEPDPRVEEAARGPDPYYANLNAARERYRRRYGDDPYRGLYGYDEGGVVAPWEMDWWDSPYLTPEMRANLTSDWYASLTPEGYGPVASGSGPVTGGSDISERDAGTSGGDDWDVYDMGGNEGPLSPIDELEREGGDVYAPPATDPENPLDNMGSSNPREDWDFIPVDEVTGEPVTTHAPIDEITDPNTGEQVEFPNAITPPPTASFRRRFTREIPQDFIPGIMPEYKYFSTSSADRGPASYEPVDYDVFGLNQVASAIDDAGFADYMSDVFGAPAEAAPVEGMAEGGMVGGGEELVQATLMALMGAMPFEQANQIIEQFVEVYGEEALEELMQIAMAMREQQSGPTKNEGMLSGPGGGQGDQIIAPVAGADPVALSSGEFIVPADVVSHLGDGDSQTGAAKLQQMMDDVRMQRTGTTTQPAPLAGIAGLR